MNNRKAYVDLASGIMTVWVLYFHALYPILDGKVLNNVPWLYFFMPWFFYKSGMFFSPKDFRTEWKNGLNKLIKTYLIWSAIGYVAHLIWHLVLGDLTLRLAFYTPLRSFLLTFAIPLNGAVWFLPILFLVRLLGNFLLQHMRALWLVLITLSLCIILKFVYIPFLPNAISGTTWGLFFFACGYWLRDIETKPWLIILAVVVYIASVLTPVAIVYGHGAPLWARVVWYPSCTLACVFFNNVCRWLIQLTNACVRLWQFPMLTYVGQHAMNFYVPHYMLFQLVFNIVGTYCIPSWYDGWQGLIIMTAVYAIVLPVINWMIIQKEKRQRTLNCY